MTRSPLQLLMIFIAALSAFTLPEAKSPVREMIQGLFVPVAVPARTLGRWASERLSPPREADIVSPTAARTANELIRQNTELLKEILNLQAQLDDLKQVSALASNLRTLVDPARVIGGPVGTRQTLTISTSTLKSIKEHMAVVHPLGFAGQIYAVAAGGGTARVLLATDPQSHLTARFVRLIRRSDGSIVSQRVDTPPPMVEGDGVAMAVKLLPARAVRGVVKVGDVVVLDEPLLPPQLRGMLLGTVRTIDLPATDAGHAEIIIDPTADFSRLREVLVVDKGG